MCSHGWGVEFLYVCVIVADLNRSLWCDELREKTKFMVISVCGYIYDTEFFVLLYLFKDIGVFANEECGSGSNSSE